MRINKLFIGIVTAACAVAGVAHKASAQNATSGAIAGVVSDAATGEKLLGVTVVATSPALQGNQSAVTDDAGWFKLTNLPPGEYLVTFYYSDITVQRSSVKVSINKQSPVYQKIDTNAAGGETVRIEDKGALIDATRTTQGVTIGQDYIKQIPVPGDTFESALGAAPGTSNDGMGVSFSGSSSLENQYVVDGVNTTGLTYGTVGSPLINDFIEEIEVITGGYQAEYGRSTGGVVNVVTKSGTNEFHGSVFSYFRNSMLTKDVERTPTQAGSLDAESNLAYDFRFGFDLGGPIIKDKLWFYVGFQPRLIAVDVDRITKRRTDCRTRLDTGELSACDPTMWADGSYDEDDDGFFIFEELDRTQQTSQATQYQFVSKINYAMSPEHQGQVSFSGQPFTQEVLGVTGEPAAISRSSTSVTTDLSGKWTSKFNDNKTEVETVLGVHTESYESSSIDENMNDVPHQRLLFGNLGTWGLRGHETADTVRGCTDSDDPLVDPYLFIENCPDLGQGYSIGGPGFLTDDSAYRVSGRLTGTQRVNAAGKHEVKGGIDLEDNRLNRKRIVSGDAYYTLLLDRGSTDIFRYVDLAPPDTTDPRFDDICGRGSGTGMGDEPVACDYTPPGNVPGQTLNWSAFAQDSWQLMPNLTFNAGVRYEEQRLRYSEHIRNTTDPFTGRPLGKNAMAIKNMWAPRLGLLYDWTKEGRSKVYSSWGRFYESIPMDINDRSFGGETYMRTTYDHSNCGMPDPTIGGPPGPTCPSSADTDNPSSETLFGSGVLVAPGIGGQYLDEFIVGSEYELLEDLKLGLSYQNRRLGRVIEDVSTDNADTYIIANPGEWSSSEEDKMINRINSLPEGDPERLRLEAEIEKYRDIRIFDKPRRSYNAIQMTAVKRFSKDIFVQGSYTYSRTSGNYQGLFSMNNGQVDPNITSQYDLIELLSNRDGPLPQDRPHYFKVDGYYRVDMQDAGELTPGIRFRALSGSPTGALGRHYLYGFDESFLLPRGSMGRVDFDYGLDLRVTYGKDIGRGMKVEAFFDTFNLFSFDFLKGQGTFLTDETYTFDPANPVVGGDYEDLIFLKRVAEQGGETHFPVRRNRNFGNAISRYSPPFARIGARLTF